MPSPTDNQSEELPIAAERQTVGMGFAVALAVAVIVALGVALVALDSAGKSARSVPATASVVVVDDSSQLLKTWEAQGLHGARLVDVTRDTTFEWVPTTSIPAPTDWPIPALDLSSVFRSSVNRNNVVWVASKTGIVRSVDYVIPRTDFEQKVAAGRAAGQPGISPDGTSVTANDEGYLRFLRTTFPQRPASAVVLNVDASYFVNGTPDGLAALLRDSGADFRLVTVNRAVDATDLPESARVNADVMVGILQGRVQQ